MAYDREFLKVSWIFAIGGTEEVAVTSLNLSAVGTWSNAEATLAELDLAGTLGQDLLDAYIDLDLVTGVLWANYSDLLAVKVAAIGTDGNYLTDAKLFEDLTPSSGAAAGIIPQSTVVLGLWSGSTFGSANYGRMYMPHTSLTLGSGVPYSDTSITVPLAAAATTFLNLVASSINAEATDNVQAFIMSNQSPKPSKPVTAVRIGRVVDTQRRRRNALDEAYSVDELA